MSSNLQSNLGKEDARELVKRISRQIVSEFSPEEIGLVDTLVEKYSSNEKINFPNDLSFSQADLPLAFGGSSGLLLTYLIPLINEIIPKLLPVLSDLGVKGIKDILEKQSVKSSHGKGSSIVVKIGDYVASFEFPNPPKNMSQKKMRMIINRTIQAAIEEMGK